MPDEAPLQPDAKAEDSSAAKDLRAELLTDLKSEFTSSLSTARTLPKAVAESLVALIGASAPTSTDVIASLLLEDPKQPESSNE